MILYLFINIFRNPPRELTGILIIDSVFIISLSIGLFFIKKGKFEIASAIDIIIVTILTIGGFLVKRFIQIETGYNSFAVLSYGCMVFAALFSSRRNQFIVSMIFIVLTISLYFYSMNAADPAVHFNLLSSTLNNIIAIIIVFSLLYNNAAITDIALELAQKELEINAELNRSLEQKVKERTVKLAEERETLNSRNIELEEVKSALIRKNSELESAKKNAEEANMAKNRFLATLSHELRTPLNGIIGISSLMMEKDFSAEDIYTLQMIKHSGENLFFIIQDLLDFTTIENNQISIKNSFFAIDELIEHITVGLKDQIENKNLTLITNITPGKKNLYSDRTRIAQIIVNLISNSIKYTRSGRIELNIVLSDKITIIVSDTGIGIREEQIESIFQAFTRIDSEYVKSQTGLGLGLSIVSQIIIMMNGKISVESTPGKGSVFTVELPLEKSAETFNETGSTVSNNFSIISGKKILVVEDNAVNRFYFNAILKKAEADVENASNGKETLYLADTVKYDVILMDLNMPDFDGLTLTRIIRSTHNPNNKTLIAALSAHAYRDHIDLCIEAGMNDFISKPVEREQFLNSICTLLENRPD
jgi:signal transduction histidine kinase/CheY-like chemotaxis protein